jgi:hypothetical protein
MSPWGSLTKSSSHEEKRFKDINLMTQMLSTQFFLSNLEANYDTMQPLKL